MDLDAWLNAARLDAERRGLPELKPLLETLAGATGRLRSAAEQLREPGSTLPKDDPQP
jgi:hypothetical protein